MAARSGILDLGSRLYPGNMQRIFNKDLTRFMQSLSRERQNQASKRKALLAGWSATCTPTECISQCGRVHIEVYGQMVDRIDIVWVGARGCQHT